MRSSRYVGACCALIAACNAPLSPTPGQPEAGSPEDCAQACAHLRAYRCPEGEPTVGEDGFAGTTDDSTCEQTCVDVEASGYTTLNPRCVAKIVACEEIERCGWSSE